MGGWTDDQEIQVVGVGGAITADEPPKKGLWVRAKGTEEHDDADDDDSAVGGRWNNGSRANKNLQGRVHTVSEFKLNWCSVQMMLLLLLLRPQSSQWDDFPFYCFSSSGCSIDDTMIMLFPGMSDVP